MFHCNLKQKISKYTTSLKSYRSLCSKEQPWECKRKELTTKRGMESNRIIITILSAQGLIFCCCCCFGIFFYWPIILALIIWQGESSSRNQIQCTSTQVILKGYRLVMWWQWQELFQQGWISVHLWGPLICLNQPWYLKVHFGKITGGRKLRAPGSPSWQDSHQSLKGRRCQPAPWRTWWYLKARTGADCSSGLRHPQRADVLSPVSLLSPNNCSISCLQSYHHTTEKKSTFQFKPVLIIMGLQLRITNAIQWSAQEYHRYVSIVYRSLSNLNFTITKGNILLTSYLFQPKKVHWICLWATRPHSSSENAKQQYRPVF